MINEVGDAFLEFHNRIIAEHWLIFGNFNKPKMFVISLKTAMAHKNASLEVSETE